MHEHILSRNRVFNKQLMGSRYSLNVCRVKSTMIFLALELVIQPMKIVF